MSIYQRNKLAAITNTRGKTLTDQSAANETDRNVIVNRFLQHGQVPGSGKQPTYADYSRLPQDLKGFLHQARSLADLKKRLPKALKGYTMDDLLALTPEELTKILTPPAPKPDDKQPPKEGT